MRRPLRTLPAFLLLVLPLAILAVLGSAELGRQQDLVDQALRDRARDFLDDAALALERAVADRAQEILGPPQDLAGGRLVTTSRGLREEYRELLDLVVLDGGGELLFPKPSPGLGTAFLFHDAPRSAALRRAEFLEEFGDHEGARQRLEAFVEESEESTERRRGGALDRLRAHFVLARLTRAEGQNEVAQFHYRQALRLAGDRRIGVRPRPELRAVALLCDVALAEISGDETQLLSVLQDIAQGSWDEDINEALLAALVERLSEEIPLTSGLRPDADLALRDDGVRAEGRAFATEYSRLLQETLRRRLSQDDSPIVYLAGGLGPGESLFAMRSLTPEETEGWLGSGASWIGVRMSLDILLSEVIAGFRNPDEEGFHLVVESPEGASILATATPEELADSAEAGESVREGVAGLRLRALPAQAEAWLASRRASVRNRALLILFLICTAAGGAVFLLRWVSREAELAQLRVDLVSRVSHELKTPLALIKMYSETIGLGRSKSPEQTKDFAGVIQREADHLTRLVERVLDFSRKDAGKLVYRPEPQDLAALVERVVGAYRPHLEARGCAVETRIETRPRCSVDRTAFESALLNLLENAAKYGGEATQGEPIEVGVVPGDDGTVAVEVRDRGVGIPAEEREAIFRGFYRASNAGEVRGAGLGLSLVQHFAAGHGGSVSAEPRPGGGTTFRIQLPIEGHGQRDAN